MASVSLSKKLSDSRYNNWVKASLAVLITKEGIEPFVEKEIEHFQQKCLTDICNNQGLPSGTICTNCCTENVVKCPTNKICNYNNKPRKCSYHKNSATSFLPAGCPNKICDNFKAEIQKAHRFNGPSYKNTDATQWCSKSWEVAKCFMPPDGYKDVVSVSETDFNGVNSVIINCKCFQTKVTDDLSKNGNIFDKLKDDTLLIGKDDVQKVIDDVAKVAHDKIKTRAEKMKNKLIEATRKYLATLESKEKVTLAELDNALKFAIGVLENQTKVSRKRIITETDRGVKKMKNETKSGVSLIHKATDEGANKILKESETAMDQVKQTLENQTKVSRKRINTEYDRGVKKLKTGTKSGVSLIHKATDEGANKVLKNSETAMDQVKQTLIEELKKANKHEKEEEYIAAKTNLQSDLIAFYRENCSTINICPSLEEVDASLKDVYIRPYPLYSKETDPLKKVAKQSTIKKETHEDIPNYFKDMQAETQDGKPVNSLQEIFNKQSKECMNIYLTAEPGLGKTSFVKWLSLNWCQARDPVEDDNYFDQEEVNQLKRFDFVFVIFLRKINDKNMSVDSMIRNTILPDLGRQNKYTIDMIERVMCEERCLIVLDGLDEWNVSGIPKRPIRPSCTYITTSRPWKFSSIAFSSKEIDQIVCIENVHQLCKKNLISSIMTMFERRKHLRKDISDISKACEEFNKVLEDKKVTCFYGIPVILAHLVYLWNMEKSIGNSQFEIYSDMVDVLFSRAEDKIGLSKFKNTRSSQISYFQSSLCETYFDLMIRLGKLAFYMLFSNNKLSSLVFDEEVTEKFITVEDSNILADEILVTCLKTGLLSKQPVYVKSKRKKYTYSFQHKTVQEYFAALYIQAEYDTNLEVMIVKKCNSFWTVLEMETVFMFLSGVSPSISGRVFQSLQVRDIQKYKNESFKASFFVIRKMQDMKVNCAIECRDNGNKELNIHLDDVIIDMSITEGKYCDVLKALVQQNALNLKSFMFVNRKKDFFKSQRDFEIEKMSSLCSSNVCFDLSDRGVSSSEIVTFISELNAIHLQFLYVSSELALTHGLLEKFLLFVKKQTSLVAMFVQFRINDIILPGLSFPPENVPSSQLQLNKHLQQLTLENVPLSQLQLNENLQQLTLKNVPLSQLQLNKHLQWLALDNVPVSQLQLNKHLQELTLIRVPLSQLQLNEQLKALRLCCVPILSSIQWFTITFPALLKNKSVSGDNIESVNITGSLNSLEKCSMDDLPVTTVTAILICLPVESKLKILSCERLNPDPLLPFIQSELSHDSTEVTALFSTLSKFCHLQKIKLSCMDLCENVLELPCIDGLQLKLIDVTVTNKLLYNLLSTKQNVRIYFFAIKVRDDTVEYELHTSEQDGSIKAECCSSIGNRIEFDCSMVEISSKSFLQFVKVVEKCNSKVDLKIQIIHKNEDKQYREGIDYAKCLSSFIVTEDVRYESLTVEIIKNV